MHTENGSNGTGSSLARLAAGVAHDLNNLFGVILPNAELILQQSDPDSAAFRQARAILNATRRGTNLARNLALLSPYLPGQERPSDLNIAVRKAIGTIRSALGSEVEVEFLLHPEPVPVIAGECAIEQLLHCLAVSARGVMPTGGSFRVATSANGNKALLTVSDTGTPIAPGFAAGLFEPFSRRCRTAGKGLELSIAAAILHACDESISVTSGPEDSTELTAVLPLANRP